MYLMLYVLICCCRQWLNYTNIHPFLIRFSDNRVEEKFVTENDPLYKYYLIAVLFIFITLFTINSLSSLSGSIFSYLPYVVLVMPLVFLAYSAWHDYIMNVNKHHDRPSLPQNPRGLINSTLTAWSRDGFTKRIRVTIFILTSILLTGVVLFNLVGSLIFV